MASSDRLSSPRQAGPVCGGSGAGNYPDPVDGKCIHFPTTQEEFQQDLDSGALTSDKTAQELYTAHIRRGDEEAADFFDKIGGVGDDSLVSKAAELLEPVADAIQAGKDFMSELFEAQTNTAEDRAGSAVLAGASDVAFKEQCFLLSYVAELSNIKKQKDMSETTPYKSLPYYAESAANNASLLLDGDPFGFVNKLTMHSSQKAFFNMETKDLSKLQPMIRLFKIIEDENGEEIQQEMSFDSHLTADELNIFKTKESRGVGAGIRSFTFSYEAANPFALKKSIKARLSLFANSFQELLRFREINF